jgi:hypothetical protein
MSEEDLELLITMDDPGEDTLGEDTFHLQADNSTAVSDTAKSVLKVLDTLKWENDRTRDRDGASADSLPCRPGFTY